jgi:hypothetical protein
MNKPMDGLEGWRSFSLFGLSFSDIPENLILI